MSITYNTYVGPYVRCAVEFKDVIDLKKGCVNAECPNHKLDRFVSGKFCMVCGSPIGDVPYTERKEAVDRWEVSEEIDQRFSDPGGDGYYRWVEENKAHLWLPNIDAGIPRNGHLESQEVFALADIQAADIQTETEQFTTFFAAELALLRSRYGEAAVSIHWGIIQHYY